MTHAHTSQDAGKDRAKVELTLARMQRQIHAILRNFGVDVDVAQQATETIERTCAVAMRSKRDDASGK